MPSVIIPIGFSNKVQEGGPLADRTKGRQKGLEKGRSTNGTGSPFVGRTTPDSRPCVPVCLSFGFPVAVAVRRRQVSRNFTSKQTPRTHCPHWGAGLYPRRCCLPCACSRANAVLPLHFLRTVRIIVMNEFSGGVFATSASLRITLSPSHGRKPGSRVYDDYVE